MNKDHSVFKEKIISFFSFNQHCGLILLCANVFIDWNWFSSERCGPWDSCYLLNIMPISLPLDTFQSFLWGAQLSEHSTGVWVLYTLTMTRGSLENGWNCIQFLLAAIMFLRENNHQTECSLFVLKPRDFHSVQGSVQGRNDLNWWKQNSTSNIIRKY